MTPQNQYIPDELADILLRYACNDDLSEQETNLLEDWRKLSEHNQQFLEFIRNEENIRPILILVITEHFRKRLN